MGMNMRCMVHGHGHAQSCHGRAPSPPYTLHTSTTYMRSSPPSPPPPAYAPAFIWCSIRPSVASISHIPHSSRHDMPTSKPDPNHLPHTTTTDHTHVWSPHRIAHLMRKLQHLALSACSSYARP